MSITVVSTSIKDPVELTKPEVEIEETKPAAEEIPAETLEASEALEEKETDEEDSGDEGKELVKSSKGAVKRIGKLTKQREDARREAAYWRDEALKNKPTEAKPVEVVAKADSIGKPSAESFPTHEEYVEALADWKVDQKLSAREATQKQNELKSEQDKKLSGYIQKRDAFSKGREDYFERMEDIKDIPMSLTVNEALLESENGPELLYELAADPEEYKRICSLPAIQAARELGKFEASLAKSSETTQVPETKTSKAPTPIRPVGSKSTGSGKKSIFDKDLTQSEYEALRREQIAKKA